jgi:hypothetical protein
VAVGRQPGAGEHPRWNDGPVMRLPFFRCDRLATYEKRYFRPDTTLDYIAYRLLAQLKSNLSLWQVCTVTTY